MLEWEYMKLDLGLVPNKLDDIDVLNRAGSEGWELLSLTSHNLAYLKRAVARPAAPARASRKTKERMSGTFGAYRTTKHPKVGRRAAGEEKIHAAIAKRDQQRCIIE